MYFGSTLTNLHLFKDATDETERLTQYYTPCSMPYIYFGGVDVLGRVAYCCGSMEYDSVETYKNGIPIAMNTTRAKILRILTAAGYSTTACSTFCNKQQISQFPCFETLQRRIAVYINQPSKIYRSHLYNLIDKITSPYKNRQAEIISDLEISSELIEMTNIKDMLKANGKPLYIRIIDSENEDVFDGLTINLAKIKKQLPYWC